MEECRGSWVMGGRVRKCAFEVESGLVSELEA